MLKVKETEMIILNISEIKPNMLVVKLGLRIKEAKYRYTATVWDLAAKKVLEFYQVGDKISLPLIVRLYNDKLVLNCSYPPAKNTGTKKGDIFGEENDN
jgi:hypothetical protein